MLIRRPALFLVFLCSSLSGSGFRAAPVPSDQEPRLLVTVSNQFGFPLTNLKAEDFTVTQDKTARPVQSAGYQTHSVVDVMLLLETSEIGAQVRGEIEHVAGLFIDRLGEKEQMAVAGYASSADLLQDFTSSKTLLKRAASGLKYGNRPALLDSIYAVVDAGFEHAAGRRILVVIGSGMDWRNKVERREVLGLARRNAVSIFAVSFGADTGLERLCEQTAGAYYRGRELRQIRQVVENLTAAFRGNYELLLPGAALDSGRLKVEVRSAEKPRVSYRVAP